MRPAGAGAQVVQPSGQRMKKAGAILKRQAQQIDAGALVGRFEEFQDGIQGGRLVGGADCEHVLEAFVVPFGIDDAYLVCMVDQLFDDGGGDGGFSAAGTAGDQQIAAEGMQAKGISGGILAQQNIVASQFRIEFGEIVADESIDQLLHAGAVACRE